MRLIYAGSLVINKTISASPSRILLCQIKKFLHTTLSPYLRPFKELLKALWVSDKTHKMTFIDYAEITGLLYVHIQKLYIPSRCPRLQKHRAGNRSCSCDGVVTLLFDVVLGGIVAVALIPTLLPKVVMHNGQRWLLSLSGSGTSSLALEKRDM